MSQNGSDIYFFGDFELDAQQGLLTRGGELVKLSPKAFELLLYLVRNGNEVIDKQRLMEAVWPDSFVEDANISVHIAALRKLLSADDSSGVRIETFPKRGYRLVTNFRSQAAPGSPPVQNASAADGAAGGTNQNDASAVPQTANDDQPPKAARSKRALAFVGLAAVLVAAVFATYFYGRRSAPLHSPNISSIAVMPVVNDSGDPALEFMADGMTEDIIRNLSRLTPISVKARASVFQFKGREVDPRKAGTELGADAVLLAKLKRSNDRINVEYELVDVASGNILGSDRADRPASEIYSIQDDIVRVVSRRVSGAPTKTSGHAVARDAYEMYLRGRFALNRRTIPDMKQAIGFFQQAINIEPDYALAYAGLADAHIVLRDWGGASPEDAMPQAKDAVMLALAIDPELAEAHASLGQIFAHGPDWQSAEREYKSAIAFDKSFAPAYQWYAELLIGLGRFDEAGTVIRQAAELDPLSRMIRNVEARIPLFEHRYDEAVKILQRNIELDPTWGGDHDMLFHAYEGKGAYPEALDANLRSLELLKMEPEAEIKLSRDVFAKQGWKGFARHRLKVLEERAKTEFVRPFILAEWSARSGDLDKAFAYLKIALAARHGTSNVWLKCLPVFENVRSDPRYKELERNPSSSADTPITN